MNHIKTDAQGNKLDSPELLNIEAQDEVVTLSKDDIGKVLALSGAGVAITLPAVADIEAGWHVKAIVTGAITSSNFTIVAQTSVIQGSAIVNGAHVAAVDENTISFVIAPADPGDYVDILFDGTNFLVNGSAVAAGAITFTVV